MGAYGSPDHLVGPFDKGWGNGDTAGLGGLEVEDQLELGELLHRQVGRTGASQALIDIGGSVAEPSRPAWSVRHETTRLHKLSRMVDRWQAILGRDVHQPLQVPPGYFFK